MFLCSERWTSFGEFVPVRLNNHTYMQCDLHPSIQPFSDAASPALSRRTGACPTSWCSGKGGVAPSASRQFIPGPQRKTNNHSKFTLALSPTDNLEFTVCLGCMFLDGGRKWQYSGRTCKLRLQTQVSRPQPSYCLTISFGMKNFQVKCDMAMTFSHTQSLIQSWSKNQTSFKWQRVCRWDCHSSSNTPRVFFPDIFLYGQGLPPSLTQLPWTFHYLLAFHRHQGVCNTQSSFFFFLKKIFQEEGKKGSRN